METLRAWTKWIGGHRVLSAAVLAVLVVFVLFARFYADRSNGVVSDPIQRGAIVQSVYGIGTVTVVGRAARGGPRAHSHAARPMIFLALRYLLARKRQTLLTLLGVFFGTMAYVSVSGFFVGFQNYLVEQLVNNSAQVHVQARQDYLTEHQLDQSFYGKVFEHVFWQSAPSGVSGYPEVQDPQSWYARLDADPRVMAFSPLMTAPALFTLAKISVSASLIGCDPEKQAQVTSIANYMVTGKFSDIGVGGNRIIIGDELMKRLGAGIDDVVLVSVGTNKPVPFRVIGYFYTGNQCIVSRANCPAGSNSASRSRAR